MVEIESYFFQLWISTTHYNCIKRNTLSINTLGIAFDHKPRELTRTHHYKFGEMLTLQEMDHVI